MRTVDPEKWWKKRKLERQFIRPLRFDRNGLEMRIRSSFCDAMKEYWRNCSIKGMNRLSDGNLPKCERYYHITVLVLTLWLGVSVLTYGCVEMSRAPPLQVNMQSLQHSIQRMPFPGVALCSTNVILEGPLRKYTQFLYSKDENSTYSLEAIRDNLLKFGALLTMTLPPVDVMFMQFLARVDPNFNVTKLMYTLSSSCSSMLKRCSWRNRIIPCERLFASRVTPLGYCCVFNSRYYPEDINTSPKYLDIVGRDNGLTVMVKENSNDFVFNRRASVGLEVLLFDGSEYPLLQGGGVRMYPVEQNASIFMSLSARAQYPVQEAVHGCRRRPAGGAGSRQSYAWCLTQCRQRTLAALCACRHHTLIPDPSDTNPVCTLTHLDCLNKHREKFIYYYPKGYTDQSLDEELQNGQDCSQCAPDCTRYVYSASLTVARYKQVFKNHTFFMSPHARNQKLINSTFIRLFYSSQHQKLYAVENNWKWIRIVATLSSEWSVIFGMTLITVPELVFHCTLRWRHHYRRRTKMATSLRLQE